MVTGIGQRGVDLSAIRQPARDLQAPSGNGRSKFAGEEGVLRRPGQYREIRAGFGENTQSSLAAAMDTLDITLQESRRIVPSIEALMAEARSRRVEESKASQDRPESGAATGRETAAGVPTFGEAARPAQGQAQRLAMAEVRIPESYRPEFSLRSGLDRGPNNGLGAAGDELAASVKEPPLRRLDVLV